MRASGTFTACHTPKAPMSSAARPSPALHAAGAKGSFQSVPRRRLAHRTRDSASLARVRNTRMTRAAYRASMISSSGRGRAGAKKAPPRRAYQVNFNPANSNAADAAALAHSPQGMGTTRRKTR